MAGTMRGGGRAPRWEPKEDPHMMLPPTPASRASSSSSSRSAAAWPRCQVGAVTLANVGKGTENQDSYITTSNEGGSKFLVGVFDGHGVHGKRMSEFAKNALSRNLRDCPNLQHNPRLALEGAYEATQREIERLRRPDAEESGTTAVAAYQHRDKLFVANVGDSRAVLGRSDNGAAGLRAVELSSDHKPNRADEKQRIIAAGGRVDQSAYPVRGARGDLQWLRVGPERVMSRDGMGGLAMSRSLGDLKLRPYVSSLPEFVERRLDARDKVMVVGSDGVWDHMTSQEAVEIAGRQGDPNAAAKEIAAVARRRWQAETDGQLSDDITAVVLRFEHQGADGALAGPPPGHGASKRSRPSQEEVVAKLDSLRAGVTSAGRPPGKLQPLSLASKANSHTQASGALPRKGLPPFGTDAARTAGGRQMQPAGRPSRPLPY